MFILSPADDRHQRLGRWQDVELNSGTWEVETEFKASLGYRVGPLLINRHNKMAEEMAQSLECSPHTSHPNK